MTQRINSTRLRGTVRLDGRITADLSLVGWDPADYQQLTDMLQHQIPQYFPIDSPVRERLLRALTEPLEDARA